MNLIDQQIAKMIREYPLLYESRYHALNYLFVINGGSYEWQGGILVDPYPNEREGMTKKEILADYSFWMDKQLLGYRIDHADEIAVSREVPEGFQWYPLCEHANIMNIPDDIHPDYLDAALETANAIVHSDPPWSNCYAGLLSDEEGLRRARAEWAYNATCARQILKRYSSR